MSERWNGCSLLEPISRPCGVLGAIEYKKIPLDLYQVMAHCNKD